MVLSFQGLLEAVFLSLHGAVYSPTRTSVISEKD